MAGKNVPQSLLKARFPSLAYHVPKIAIRAEDPVRIWERRAPLTPDAVYELTSKEEAVVKVEPCARRIFKDDEYRRAGAKITHDIGDAEIIIGIKEPQIPHLTAILDNTFQSVNSRRPVRPQTHFMFSHTAKGQPYNTPLLAQFVRNPLKEVGREYRDLRLVDYELLMDQDGKRTVGFGWFAGVAGVLESLSSMAHSHLEIGVASPFLYTPRPHTLPSLEALREALRAIGSAVATQGTPPQLGPFIFGVTGTGNVAQGCLSMLAELPIEYVSVADLPSVVKLEGDALKKIYIVHAKPEDYFVRVDGGKYDRTHYYQSPQSYISVFAEKVAPYLTLFLNGAGWSPSFPRLVSNDQLGVALQRAQDIGGARFTNIADISCDVEGGLEFLTKATTLSSPFYKIRARDTTSTLPEVQMMSVDILPASIPFDASRHFSAALQPYLRMELKAHVALRSGKRLQYPKALADATIAYNGELKEKHKWLGPSVQTYHSSLGSKTEAPIDELLKDGGNGSKVPYNTQRKKILLLGSGMVAQPAVDLIAGRHDVDLVIGSNSLVELQALVGPHNRVKYRIIDIDDRKTYDHLVAKSDVVISLLPATMHTKIAKSCINHRTHLVTASYTSTEMHDLNKIAQQRNVLLLNEIGLDPGIDHCSALDLLGRLKGEKKIITSFTSFCGGLPAPEDSHVPLRYKFSWRPLGMLTAALNQAVYLLDNQKVRISSDDLLQSYFPKLPITSEFELEGLPNRDSLSYIKDYHLQTNDLATFVRGTLRYPGFSTLMSAFKKIGFLNNKDTMYLTSWETFFPQSLSLLFETEHVKSLPSLPSIITTEELKPLQDALEWLGLVKSPLLVDSSSASRGIMPPLPEGNLTPLEIFAYLLAQKLKYEQHERDMVVLSHEIISTTSQPQHPPQSQYQSEFHRILEPASAAAAAAADFPPTQERHTSTLITYATQSHNVGFLGERPASAMARTVGIPIAIAALLVADGKLRHLSGVKKPLVKDVYKPVLEGLARVGLVMTERSVLMRTWKGGRGWAESGNGGATNTVEEALRDAERLREVEREELKLEGRGVGGRKRAYDLDHDLTWEEDGSADELRR